MALVPLAKYSVTPFFRLIIAQGSVLDFTGSGDPTKSAIVNAANTVCLGGGGVDGAITTAGGEMLARDRLALPILSESGSSYPIRCRTGSAVLTGPNSYGSIATSYVIHAVGPDFCEFSPEIGKEMKQGKSLLASAYQTSLQLARDNHIDSVGFSLLSAGVYRGTLSVKQVLQIGVKAIRDWALQQQQQQTAQKRTSTMDVTLCAFTDAECQVLQEICSHLVSE